MINGCVHAHRCRNWVPRSRTEIVDYWSDFMSSFLIYSSLLFHQSRLKEFSLNYTQRWQRSQKRLTGEWAKWNQQNKLPALGIEPRTSWCLLQCLTDWAKQTFIAQEISELNFVSCTTALYGLGSFQESIEHNFIKLSKIQTDNQMSTQHS